jgi:hypothetical protein
VQSSEAPDETGVNSTPAVDQRGNLAYFFFRVASSTTYARFIHSFSTP